MGPVPHARLAVAPVAVYMTLGVNAHAPPVPFVDVKYPLRVCAVKNENCSGSTSLAAARTTSLPHNLASFADRVVRGETTVCGTGSEARVAVGVADVGTGAVDCGTADGIRMEHMALSSQMPVTTTEASCTSRMPPYVWKLPTITCTPLPSARKVALSLSVRNVLTLSTALRKVTTAPGRSASPPATSNVPFSQEVTTLGLTVAVPLRQIPPVHLNGVNVLFSTHALDAARAYTKRIFICT